MFIFIFKLNKQEEAEKQSEFRRWLKAQGSEFKDGTNHLKVFLNGKQTTMPRHPNKEIPEPLRKLILKQLGIK
ncbi:type II toxin-antitoxin system HicA family toxin [Photorhabdus sp. P32]|uniref:type II toxin-antitoxin system HicA family toxin n=1 Tax=Photorhabdus sp. P32 TaxID=3117549 RepID=UPI00311AEF13